MTDHAVSRLTERFGLTFPEATDLLQSLEPQARALSSLLRKTVHDRSGVIHRPVVRFSVRILGMKVHLVWDYESEVFRTAFPSNDPAPQLDSPF